MKQGISIIIFDIVANEKELCDCLGAIACQKDMPNGEIIIFSNNVSRQILCNVQSLLGQIRVHIQHIGAHDDHRDLLLAATRMASYEYLLLIDCFTQFYPEACSTLYTYAKTNQLDVVLSKGILNSPIIHRDIITKTQDNYLDNNTHDIIPNSYLSFCGTLVRHDSTVVEQLSLSCKSLTFDEILWSSFVSANKSLIRKCGVVSQFPYSYQLYLYDGNYWDTVQKREVAVALYNISDGLKRIDASVFQDVTCFIILQKMIDVYGSHLRYCAQKVFEQYLRASNKKCLFIISTISLSSQYGIGTYIKNLVKCFNPHEWDIVSLAIGNQSKNIQFLLSEVASYNLPCPESDSTQTWEEIEQTYNYGVLCYFASIVHGKRNLFCHANVFNNLTLVKLFKTELHARIVFCLHYTRWGLGFNGRILELKPMFFSPKNSKEKQFQQTFNVEKDFFLNYCDSIIAIAEHSYHTLAHLYQVPTEKLRLIPHNVSESFIRRDCISNKCKLRMKYNFDSQDILFVYAGRIEKLKGIYDLIDAFRITYSKHRNIHLIIAGEGNFSDALKCANESWPNIHFVGFVPHGVLQELFSMADIGVVPSIYEEFGYVAIEMLSCGLKVIARDTGGLSEIVNKRGILFDESKPLCIAMEEAITDIKNQEFNQVHDLSQFSFERFKDKVNSLYSSLTISSNEV